MFKRILIFTIFIALFFPAVRCYSEEADTHYERGLELEKLRRETEATAEYLKILVNYPEAAEAAKKAEARLSSLYKDFSARTDEPAHYKPSDEQKDPTVFFAYVKSLYENYRNLGQYDKALGILEKLYDLDDENQSYLVEIGNIYLEGHNDADKAVFHLKKAISLNPDMPKAYVDLAKAYEKKGDFESALGAYAEGAKRFPSNPWSIYGLKRTEGIRLAKDKLLVKDWRFSETYPNSDRMGLNKVFPPEENRDIKWKRPFTYSDSGYVDLNAFMNPNDYVVAYALTYVYSAAKRDVIFRMGSDNGIKVWLNDIEIWNNDIDRSAEADEDVVRVAFKQGWNKILLKVSETWGSWGFYFRITNPNGTPAQDLIFDPLKNEKRLRETYGELKKRKHLKVTGIALLYTGALSIFLLGLYFMISNITGRMTINRMKEDFISSVSHELKTPISAIKILAETLKKDADKNSRKEDYCSTIIKESDRLTRFINKILDFAKLEKGGEIFRFEKSDLAGLAREASDIYKNETQDSALKIRLNAEKDSVFAEIDKEAMLHVALNLMDNAYKYAGSEKEIEVNVAKSGKNAVLEVIDKGPGIPKDEIGKIFDKFYRVGKNATAGAKGSGLGLAFAKGVVEAHKGAITCESKPGHGSKFTVTLPAIRG